MQIGAYLFHKTEYIIARHRSEEFMISKENPICDF
jgi:hypothetical protein